MTVSVDTVVWSAVEIPVRHGPIRFAIRMPNGLTSNAWRVWTEDSGAYICCRDNMQEIKISLHSSGKHHIAFSKDSGIKTSPGSRFWNQWKRPPQKSPAIASFKLLFPSWGIQLTSLERSKTRSIRKKWDKNHIYIEADDQSLAVISFMILHESTTLNLTGDYPAILIGKLPFRNGNSLLVIASKDPEGDLRSVVESGLAKVHPELAQKLLEEQGGSSTPVACLSGDSPEGYAYMVVVPVHARARP